jgi:hypothetical protein
MLNYLLLVAFTFATICYSQNAYGQNSYEAQPGPKTFSTPPASQDEAISQLHQIIEADYPFWTGGPDKPLTIHQIGRLQRNPSITGGQAVLLGVLALTIDHAHGFIDRLSSDSVIRLAQGETITVNTDPNLAGNSTFKETPTFTFRNVVKNYKKLFDNLTSNTNANGFKLWGNNNGPTVDGLQQGPTGDCYWIAAVEAVALKRPEFIAKTIRQVSPNQFELRFLGRDEPIVVTLTHGEMAQLNLDPHDGCWLTVLALGEAHIRNASNDTVQFWRETPLGVVAHSGSQRQVLECLTGQKYQSLNPDKLARGTVSMMLAKATQEAMPVGIGTGDHCLSLSDYNPQTQILTILNPWGTSDTYQIEGSDLQYQMNNGIFQMSLADACQAFDSLVVPTAIAQQVN